MSTADAALFAPDFKESPYWWDAAPPTKEAPRAPPGRVDVAIVGAGITGLNAALVLARAGRSVVALDASDLGHGASTRNSGYVGRTLKHSFSDLVRKHGAAYATAAYREMQMAFDAVAERVRTEQIECAFKVCGRLVLTKARRQYEDLERELVLREKHLGSEFTMLSRTAVRDEIASDLYCGGALIPDLAALHPGLYHRGLLERARAAGADLIGGTPVERIVPLQGGGFDLETPRGTTRAREVLVATNGYTDGLLPWLQRRLIPFDAYMIATEPLPPALMNRLLPTDRTYIDHVFDVVSIRRSPDGTRILFLWRTGTRPTGARAKGAQLLEDLSRIVPEAASLKLTHSWTGRCALTRDLWPHVATHDGIHFAGGYCFAGVPMGTYLGQKAAHRILGSAEGKTIFADRGFPSVPVISGSPWLARQAMTWYRARDRWASR
ncbi:MAG TPA: FAD-binding oxidoreductase [Stellaceae bacterium]|jgi:glycine/D-amino acid oxidase-like deaminating enzyme|nr:FAD-binding oxidoreductase [Stellaceae bacterium]